METIDWNFELSLCEKCAEKKNGNYHAWNHRQWVLQKSPELLNFELIKTEKFIRKNISDYSCYHHRNIIFIRLFDFGYYDLEDIKEDNLIRYVNDVLQGKPQITNLNDLITYLIPNVPLAHINSSKLNCFIYCLNFAFNDLKFIKELKTLHGSSSYEAFECYKRITIKFIIDIIRIVNQTNYLVALNFNNNLDDRQKDQPESSSNLEDIEFNRLLSKHFEIDKTYSNFFLNIH